MPDETVYLEYIDKTIKNNENINARLIKQTSMQNHWNMVIVYLMNLHEISKLFKS